MSVVLFKARGQQSDRGIDYSQVAQNVCTASLRVMKAAASNAAGSSDPKVKNTMFRVVKRCFTTIGTTVISAARCGLGAPVYDQSKLRSCIDDLVDHDAGIRTFVDDALSCVRRITGKHLAPENSSVGGK